MLINKLLNVEDYKAVLRENGIPDDPIELTMLRSRVEWEREVAPSGPSNREMLELAHAELNNKTIRNLLFKNKQGSLVNTSLTTAADKLSLQVEASRIISRKLAIFDVLSLYLRARALSMPRIFLAEAISSFSLAIRGRFFRVLASEYCPSNPEKLFPIPHIDLQNTYLPDQSFDVLISSDVIEHMPDPDKSFHEAYRILSDNGMYIFSIPFVPSRDASLLRARINESGEVEHLTKPEYHGDQLNPDKGILAFHTFGWDVIKRLSACGFRDSCMCYISNYKSGIVGRHYAGCILFCALR